MGALLKHDCWASSQNFCSMRLGMGHKNLHFKQVSDYAAASGQRTSLEKLCSRVWRYICICAERMKRMFTATLFILLKNRNYLSVYLPIK